MNGPAFFAVPRKASAFASSLARQSGGRLFQHDRVDFPSGEMVVRVPTDAITSAVIVLAPTGHCSDSLIEITLLADALMREGAPKITCVFQYLPYSRSNRLDRRGAALGARVVISMLERAPIDRFVVFDLHTREVLGFFTKPVRWIQTLPALSGAMPLRHSEVVVSPDRGRYDDIVDISNLRGSAIDLLVKVRTEDGRSSHLAAGARTDIHGRNVLLYDDESWTGVTAVHAAESLFAAGAARIDYSTVYDFASADVRRRLIVEGGISTYTTTNLARPDLSDDYDDRYRVVDVAELAVAQLTQPTEGALIFRKKLA